MTEDELHTFSAVVEISGIRWNGLLKAIDEENALIIARTALNAYSYKTFNIKHLESCRVCKGMVV